ncbi:MAG: 1-acyl-sn-glycerol-3-phosphate acyltransferase [Bacteroidales bacterium]|nr:1-acyl-sn-glycerol-3-phosphate acyltransferase [Bacteroidales bacterium]
MGIHNIGKKSLGYKLLYFWVRIWHNVVFYRKIIVHNSENIPRDARVIFTPNHQNALMDATALLFTVPRRLVFMARADIFAKPAVAAILYFLKILPIYRDRDGKEAVKKNEMIFERTVDILTAGNGLVILPEGSHEGVHKLRPLKKGFARIAFQTEEINNFSLDLKILPVGIDYSNYQDLRTTLLVNFGPVISVSDYYAQYRESPAIAMKLLKDELAEKMKELIVNIESGEFYGLYDEFRDVYSDRMCANLGFPKVGQPYKLKADQEFVHRFSQYEKQNPDAMPGLQKLLSAFASKRDKFGMTNRMLANGADPVSSLLLKSFLLLFTFPLFVYGWLNNFLPYGITVWAGKKIKDPQFRSSFKFVVSMLAFPIFYLFQTVAVFFVLDRLWLVWAYLFSLPLSAALAWRWASGFTHLRKQWGFFRLHKSKPSEFMEMLTEYKLLLEKADQIVSLH